MRNPLLLMCLLSASTIFAMGNASAGFADSYDSLLKKYVHAKKNSDKVIVTSVDYDGFRNSPERAKTAADLRNASNIEKLTKRQQLAFWINAYNFLAMNKVAENPKIKKLTDLNTLFTSVWKQAAGIVAGKQRTLDQIEHSIIRKRFKEPRVHFALVCVARSCPNIRNEVYTGEKLNEQLDDQMRQFLANTAKGMRIDKKNERIYLSKIFSWFAGDFGGDPMKWLYERKIIDKNVKNNYSLKYLGYDWNLNKKEVSH